MNFHYNEVFQNPIGFPDVLDEDNSLHMSPIFDQYEYDATFVETN
jgi:hypothetical protein